MRWNGGRCRYGIGVYIIVAAALPASAAGPQVSGGTARRDRPSSIRAPRPARREETGFKRKSMPKVLSDAAVAQYHDKGYYFPVHVLSPAEAADCRRRIEAFEASQGGRLRGNKRIKLHVLFPWSADPARHPPTLQENG